MARSVYKCKGLGFKKDVVRKFSFLLILIFCLKNYAQEKTQIYVDENLNKISKSVFTKKLNSPLYYAYSYDSDSLVVKRVFLKYFMGNLPKSKRHQLFSLLKQRNAVDTTKSILIHYNDTLKAKKSFPIKDSIIKLKNGNHRHIDSYETFARIHKKCVQANSNKFLNVYHYYNVNKSNDLSTRKESWQKDHLGLIRKIFHNNSYNTAYWYLIIHTNGDFVINHRGVGSDYRWQRMKKHKNWDKYLKESKELYFSLNPDLKQIK